MTDHGEYGWWKAIKDRLSFYSGITTCIVIDACFLLIQHFIARGFRWGIDMLHTGEHAESSILSSQNILEGVIDWGTFCVIVFYILNDVIKIGRKIWYRMKND